MKPIGTILVILAMAAFSTSTLFAKGHSGGHAHHSGSHHAAHHSASHSSHPKASHSKAHTKPAAKHTTTKTHPAANSKDAAQHTANKPATTPRVSHANLLSTHRRGGHYGYGRNHHRQTHYRRNGARPAFTVGPDQIVAMNSGPRIVAPWATIVSSGGNRQGGRAAHFQVTGNSNPALFSELPTVSPTGALSFTPAAGQSGAATLTLVLRSSGGSSAPQTFHITVKPA